MPVGTQYVCVGSVQRPHSQSPLRAPRRLSSLGVSTPSFRAFSQWGAELLELLDTAEHLPKSRPASSSSRRLGPIGPGGPGAISEPYSVRRRR